MGSLLLALSAPSLAQTPWKWESNSTFRVGQGYEFKWSSPSLLNAPGEDSEVKAWNELLETQMNLWADEFSREAVAAFEDAKKEGYQANAWSSEGDFKIVWQDSQTLVVTWNGYDYRGGAHGLPFQEVQVLSLKAPGKLHPSSFLFEKDPGALELISKLARKALDKEFDAESGLDEWALKGTAAQWDNYTLLYPTEDDNRKIFEVVFTSYQVAPYAAGTPTVQLDFETLAPLAKNLGSQ